MAPTGSLAQNFTVAGIVLAAAFRSMRRTDLIGSQPPVKEAYTRALASDRGAHALPLRGSPAAPVADIRKG